MPELYELTGREVSEKIRSGELTVKEYISSILERIRKVEEKVHAFVTVLEEDALKRAEEIDRKADGGHGLGRLCGVAVAVKDNICTKGVRTTCSSRMLKDFVPPYNATVIERLLREDAVIIGKTNMDEFAMGSTTETSYFGATRNPWNLTLVPGGSSGGSAAAVAAGEATLALGSDTGGSIRCPASYCNVVGLKPTYGLVSRYGLIAYANSLEQIGPITIDTYDCALLLSVIAGHDPKDSTSVKTPQRDYVDFLEEGVEGFKIGVPSEFFGEGVDARVKECVWRAIHTLESLGATYEEVSLPSLEYALPAYYIIAMSEASSNLARYDGLRYGYRVEEDSWDWPTVYSKSRRIGFGTEVRRRIILGTYALSAGYYDQYYLKALKIRTLIRRDFEKAFKKFNLLAGPTMPVPPFRIGEKIQNPLELYMCDILTVPANLTGGPAVTVPCGFVDGLPVGLQLMGRPFREDLLLRAAKAYEDRAGFEGLRPKL